MRPKRVFAYCRVSSAEQGRTGTSLDGQREEIARYCAAFGLPTPSFFVEVESGAAEKIEARVEQLRLMAEVVAGDLVIVAKLDRWSRDTLHYLKSTRELVARGAHFLSLAERFDPSTPEGQFAATMMAAVAEQERSRIFARTVGRRRHLRDQGHWVEGQAPLGYRVVGRKLVVVPEEAAQIRAAYNYCINGYSLARIREAMECDHEVTRDKQVWHKMLRARVYLGEMRDTAGVYRATHEAIVDRDTFARAQTALKGRQLGGRAPGTQARTYQWLLRGLATCPRCGSRMGAAYSRGVPESDGYYICVAGRRGLACDTGYSRVSRTDKQASALTLERLKELRALLASAGRVPESETDATRIEKLEAKRTRVEGRRRRVIDLGVDGTITREEVRAKLAAIEEELGRVDVELAAARRATEASSPETRAEVLADVEAISKAWRHATIPERREALARLVDAIRLDREQLDIVWKSPSALVQQRSPGSCS